jgi:enterochelin esterase family protein
LRPSTPEHGSERLHASAGPQAWNARLQAIAAAADRPARVEVFLREARSASLPLVHAEPHAAHGHVLFLYQGAAQRVTLHSQLPGPRESHEFTCLPGTDLFYLQREVEADARIDYKFILDDGEWILDPWNLRQQESAFGTSSYFWMPAYRAPDFAHHPGHRHGTLEEIVWTSEILGNERPVKVYVPPGGEAGQRFRSVYVHDGFDYINFTSILDLVDNAQANGRVPPVLLVLVPPLEREKEYRAHAGFARAITSELLPLVEEDYPVRTDAPSRATLGASMGGLCAVHLAASYPDVFGNCAGQSSAFFQESPLDLVPLNLTSAAPRKDLRIHFDVGTYEKHYVRDLLTGNRKFSAAIRAKGYPLQYLEVHEGHSWGSWRARIIPALEFFWKP